MKKIIQNAIYIVATPIGNLGDISKRAIETLEQVDYIAAEDTRHSKTLLQHLNIHTPLLALHEHNEREQAQQLLTQVQQGAAIALISDAGTPLISDPGYHLVQQAHMMGVRVIPIPGASALICALSACGLATDRFCFEGFLPAKEHARLQYLQDLQSETRTMVFYEAPHRIIESLHTLNAVFGEDRPAVIARELTKQYETVHYGTLRQIIDFVSSDSNQQRGEFVVVIAGAPKKSNNINDADIRVLKILLKDLSVKQAASLAAEITGASKNELYDTALRLQAND